MKLLKHTMGSRKKTRSNGSGNENRLRWFSTLVITSAIFWLSACTNDYVTLDPIETERTPSSPVTIAAAPELPIEPTQIESLPEIQPTPISIQPTPIPIQPTILSVSEVGGVSGSNTVPDTLGISGSIKIELEQVEPKPMLTSMIKPAVTSNEPPIIYQTQAGDTLPALATRFGVSIAEISSTINLPRSGFLDPQQLVMIPPRNIETSSDKKVIPDSELVFSPSGLDFDIDGFVDNAGGYLSTYREYLSSSGWLDGAGVIRKVAIENSINPRTLLSILEYFSHWVYGQPIGETAQKYPLGHIDPLKKGLYSQLTWAVSQLNVSYYGWREGLVTEVVFPDGSTIKGAPDLNAGTFAIQYLFAQLLDRAGWEAAVYTDTGFPSTHQQMFGSPWLRAMTVEPLFPATITQPDLILPIEKDTEWNFTGGPHAAWGALGARAALDFSPSLNNSGCETSNEWVLAAASGVVARTGGGVVVLDLDGDGNEQTGWDLLYMHIATRDRVKAGDFVEQGQPIGHPSCEGGFSTGTHFHMARKFNGEWILAGGPLPFVMDGWEAHAAAQSYKGTLTKGNQMITACSCGTKDTVIIRTDLDPSSNSAVQ